MSFNRLLGFVFLLIFTVSCSSSKESTSDSNSSEQEVYVFDDVSDVSGVSAVSEKSDVSVDNSSTSHEAVEVPTEQKVVEPAQFVPVSKKEGKYTVQIGAFSSAEKADKFIKDIQSTINYPLIAKVNPKTGLFVVQVSSFQTREDAVSVRDKLKKISKFKDAFIVTN